MNVVSALCHPGRYVDPPGRLQGSRPWVVGADSPAAWHGFPSNPFWLSFDLLLAVAVRFALVIHGQVAVCSSLARRSRLSEFGDMTAARPAAPLILPFP